MLLSLLSGTDDKDAVLSFLQLEKELGDIVAFRKHEGSVSKLK